MTGLGDMRPALAVNDAPDGELGYAKFLPDAALKHATSPKAPNFSYIAITEFCAGVYLALWLVGTAFLNFILHVVGVRPNKQMVRIAARRVVAMMQDIESVFYEAMSEHPRLPVRQALPASMFDSAVVVAGLWVPTAQPWPTSLRPARLIYRVPEVLNVRDSCRESGGAGTLVVLPTQPSGKDTANAAVRRAGLVGRVGRNYSAGSHSEVPSRRGQRRRTVSSGRRFAFMPQNPLKSQHVAEGRAA